MKIGHPIVRIRSDRGKEFNNVNVDLFCKYKGIKHEFLALKISQQNGVVERKNIVLQDRAWVMIHIHNTPL